MIHGGPEDHRLGGVIFDVEGVIAHPDLTLLRAGLSALDPALDPDRLRSIRHDERLYPLWVAHSKGRLDADLYWRAVLQAAGLAGSEAEVTAMRHLQSQATWACLDEEVLLVADSLRRAGLRVGILSNSAVDYEPQIGRFIARFDRAHFSHRTGRRKPDAEAYLDLAAELGLDPTAILFVDDKPRNIEAARTLGMHTCLFTSASDLRATLRASGALSR